MKKSTGIFLRKIWQFPQGLAIVLFAFSLGMAGCKKDATSEILQGDDVVSKSSNSKGPDIMVQAGQSIQAAVDAAAPGAVIRIQPGTYAQALVVSKPNISIIGNGNVIIENPGDEENGIMVTDDADGFVLKNVTVQNFEENGVILIRVDDFLLSHVTTINNGEYGLFPLFCHKGMIDHCSATGHTDTGIYVGQSDGVCMEQNVAFGNTNGLEVENCTNILVEKNKAYDNVCGILVVILPGLIQKVSSDIEVSENHVYNNNHAILADPEDGFEGLIPSGSGILIVGSDNVTVEKNKISDNNFVGVATVSVLILGQLAGIPPDAFADIDPFADGVHVVRNNLSNNGTNPPALPLPGVDLLWDGTGSGNCWSDNKFSTSYPSPLPACN